jgi:diguanylate cyclase (GGDEF)-like protein
MAYLDELTGIPNRRAAREALPEVIRAGGGSVCLVDLDHFKRVNDTYGHEEGDRILRAAAHILQASLRDEDLVARWGGEEFLLILPEAPPEGAAVVAERCRAALRTIEANAPVTASFGIAPLTTVDDIDVSLARADDALYDAKAAGRDCVVLREAPATA